MNDTLAIKLIYANKQKIKITFSLIIGYIGYSFCRSNLFAAFPVLSQIFSLTNTELGLIAFYSELTYAFGKIINGLLVEKFNGKNIFLIGMIGTIILNLIFTLGDDLYFFIITWCVMRYFYSMGWMSLASICSKIYESKDYGSSMGLFSISFQIGDALSTLFVAFLISNKVGWRGLFIYPSIILFVIFLFCKLFFKEKIIIKKKKKLNKEKIINISDIKLLFLRRSFISLLNYSFLITFLRLIFIIWTPKIFVDLGSDITDAVIDSSGFLFSGILSTLFLGFYTDKISSKNRSSIMGYMLIGLPICLMFMWYIISYNLDISLLSYFITLCGFFLTGPYSMAGGAISLDIGGKKLASSCTGYVDGIGCIGGALSVYLTGKIADNYGWNIVMLLLIIISILAILSSFLLSKFINDEKNISNKVKIKKIF